jgi:hypothetical protein
MNERFMLPDVMNLAKKSNCTRFALFCFVVRQLFGLTRSRLIDLIELDRRSPARSHLPSLPAVAKRSQELISKYNYNAIFYQFSIFSKHDTLQYLRLVDKLTKPCL